ncbi:Retrovirus-related Pol polyprotein from transposon opus [Gossypium australe]|uniref:Retrovirus-related Pol polyprotein from transposon opus n=1 Tax=Gossypium australe TaxID=47621 RepID=A0A5B6VNA3_9ROSI|nr:Retrovirus-related Pol polyprotein from transposon opus [Gossypium australe]
MTKCRKIKKGEKININVECNTLKIKDPESFAIPIEIGEFNFGKALCDSGVNINMMPLSIYQKLGLGESLVHPKGVLKHVLVNVRQFIFPIDFVVLNFEEDMKIPILLGRPFLAISKSTINLEKMN